MRYQAESGDSAGALLTYERCRTILSEELGADPSPLTQQLHQRILHGRSSRAVVNTPSVPARIHAPTYVTATPGQPVELPQRTSSPWSTPAFRRRSSVATADRPAERTHGNRAERQRRLGAAPWRGRCRQGVSWPTRHCATPSGSLPPLSAHRARRWNAMICPCPRWPTRWGATSTCCRTRDPCAAGCHPEPVGPDHFQHSGSVCTAANAACRHLGWRRRNRQRLIDSIVTTLTTLAEMRPLVLFCGRLAVVRTPRWPCSTACCNACRTCQSLCCWPTVPDLSENGRSAPSCMRSTAAARAPDHRAALCASMSARWSIPTWAIAAQRQRTWAT